MNIHIAKPYMNSTCPTCSEVCQSNLGFPPHPLLYGSTKCRPSVEAVNASSTTVLTKPT